MWGRKEIGCFLYWHLYFVQIVKNSIFLKIPFYLNFRAKHNISFQFRIFMENPNITSLKISVNRRNDVKFEFLFPENRDEILFWLIFKVNVGSRVQTIWSNRCLIIRLVDHWKFQKPATAAQEIKSILTGNEYWFECQRQPIFLRRQTHCDKKCFSPKKSKYRFWWKIDTNSCIASN